MVQEVGHAKLQALGITLVAADSPHSFLDDTPTSRLLRQILGAVSEFDRAMVVAKLRGARDRKRVARASAKAARVMESFGPGWSSW
jgi:DNA invertase Pin-like site-specific DNA recombinase